MNETAHIVDIDEGNAQQLLIDESFNRPVVVDFWAEYFSHRRLGLGPTESINGLPLFNHHHRGQ